MTGRWRRHGLAPALDISEGRFVPSLVGVLVYLAALASTAMLLVGGTAERWTEALPIRLTVQLPVSAATPPGVPASPAPVPSPSPAPGAGEPVQAGDTASRVRPPSPSDDALALIRALPDVARAETMAADRLALRLQPWLGQTSLPSSMLPTVIELELRPEAVDRAAAVRERLASLLPDATVEANAPPFQGALRLMRIVEIFTALILVVLTATLVACVVFATRTRLAARMETIEILHLLGADDRILVGLLARHALQTAFVGGLGGAALAAATILGLASISEGGPIADGGAVALSPIAWAALTFLPFAASGIAVLTARLTAGRALAALP